MTVGLLLHHSEVRNYFKILSLFSLGFVAATKVLFIIEFFYYLNYIFIIFFII